MPGRMNGRHGGRFRQGSRTRLKSTTTESSNSKLIERKILNDYKYAIRTAKQEGRYDKITTYLILHIRKTYEHSGNIANTIENHELFDFNLSAPRLKILSTVETKTTSPKEELELKHENDQYKTKNQAELQLHLKQKSHTLHGPWGKDMHSYLDNTQQDYSIE